MENVDSPDLWDHQREAIKCAADKFALFFDPGTGKTRTAIELFKRSIKNYANGPLFRKAIIFAPLNVCRNWTKELEQFLGYKYKVHLVAGDTKLKKIRTIEAFRECSPMGKKAHQFLICNLESLRSTDYRKLLVDCGASFVIVDESHNFKSPVSLQTKGLIEVVERLKAPYLYLLTGTPAPQGEMDLWSTFYLLRKTQDSFFIWRKRHFTDINERKRGWSGYWPKYEIRSESKAMFANVLRDCSVTAKKNEVLDLPPLLRTTIYAEMSKIQRQHYDSMKEFLFAIDSDGNELNAANLLTRTLRLQQILAGYLGETPIAENPRLDALDSAIERCGTEQFIIWTIFKASYKEIAEKLGDNYALLTGEQSAEERFDAMEAFQTGKIRALIAHPKAGGVGVNLTAASYSIHYTRGYSLIDDLQAEARNYRGGSEIHKRITRIDIVTPDTIDEEITEALRQKKTVQDFILGLKEKHKNDK